MNTHAPVAAVITSRTAYSNDNDKTEMAALILTFNANVCVLSGKLMSLKLQELAEPQEAEPLLSYTQELLEPLFMYFS